MNWDNDYLVGLVRELRKLPVETGWAEFKENNVSPDDIGQYLSALSNTAALQGKANAYLVWGIRDGDHAIVGTSFQPHGAKKGNEDLQPWLLRLLSPRIQFSFHEIEVEGKPVVLLEIPRASGRPVQFEGEEWIRVGSYRKRLKDHPQLERELWRVFDSTPFEEIIAAPHLSEERVLSLLDYRSYFGLLQQPVPTGNSGILSRLADEEMIVPCEAGGWDITNLGALLLANDLDDFRSLKRKRPRVVVYEGRGRLRTRSEPILRRGYACGFDQLTGAANPRTEVIEKSLRREVTMFPELAVRELIANALIHQDFSATGTGPMIEIFSDRLEVTNPGPPLMTIERLLDTPPRSRNEVLASFMRRVGICEERGSGVDKVVSETEFHQLPAPLFETPDDSTRVVLFTHKPFNAMDRDDRVRACYLHACLRYVERDPMTNSSLRERFGIEEQNSAIASRVIRDALEGKFIKPYDPDQGKKYAKYLPFWA